MAKTHMSLSTIGGAAALVVGVSLVTILLACDLGRISTPVRQYFSVSIITTHCHQNHVQHAVLGLSKYSTC